MNRKIQTQQKESQIKHASLHTERCIKYKTKLNTQKIQMQNNSKDCAKVPGTQQNNAKGKWNTHARTTQSYDLAEQCLVDP